MTTQNTSRGWHSLDWRNFPQHMFPLNEKNHNMETRKEEKYKVEFANTDRKKDSPIIYMQKLLNQNENNK